MEIGWQVVVKHHQNSFLGMCFAISCTLAGAPGGKVWAEQNAGIGISVQINLPFVS